MTKRRKPRKALENTSSSMRPNSISKSIPRTNQSDRQLRRFYEPLILLYTLGSTRGVNTPAVYLNQEDITHMPVQDVRRRFLGELAYACDYDKGGDTVTAIGLEATPQHHIYWLASNSRQEKKIVPFLQSLLTKMRDVSTVTTPVTPEIINDVAAQCIDFSTPRIKKYKSHLSAELRKCQIFLRRLDEEDVTGLAEWLNNWEHYERPLDLCCFAYDNRNSDFMHTLARLATEPTYKSTNDAMHEAFRLVRHYIGRLGHHFRVARLLLSCISRLPDLLHDFQVRSIPTPPKSVVPPADSMTRLESIIVRMLPANSPDLDRYRKMLIEMDHRYQLSDRFLEHYTKRELKPRVHAEIQVLEDFYTQRRSFVGGDPFIACSKPACFCCLLYFRYHPGRFVEPASHRKIYLNWLPPGFDVGCDRENQNYRRDILNSMTRDIRMEALQQIDGKVAPQPWHPDSITGITESLTQEQKKELRVDTTQQISTAKGIFTVHKLQLSGGGEILTIRDFSSPLTEPCDDDPACSADDDSEGGILL